ncbi:hypothetical protein [Paludisphaera borealis]|uniref:hypothetical protein n=1 Tax=Paludisphaera borealis TaxID=1387353 RepID=UPI0011AB5466|nr:hypothetical protein [Paludisphaera borealis]
MNTTATYFRIGLTAVVYLAAGLHVQADDERTKLDSGVNALFLLHRLEGRPGAVEQLLSKLPAHNPEGYSMAELASSSASRRRPHGGGSVHPRHGGRGVADRPLDAKTRRVNSTCPRV